MPSIENFTMTYDMLNEDGTFSEGDTLTGEVTLVLSKENTVESLFVKAKGDADVSWTESSGDDYDTYSAHKRYFKLKQFLIQGNTKVPKGVNVYKFSFNIPTVSMPSSFKGKHGKIIYKLEAELSRSWRMNRTLKQELRFVSKSYPDLHSLMSSQAGSTGKEMGLFSKGRVNMEVTVDKKGYAPGETVAIVAKINNASSKKMTPKFRLLQDVVFRAEGRTKEQHNVIHKVVDHCMKSQTQKDVRCAMQIPPDVTPSIHNCDIISVEFYVKAYLDISFAFDPEIVIPILIIPPELARGPCPPMHACPYPAGAVWGPNNSDFPPPAAASIGPYPPRNIWGPSNSNFPPPAAASIGPYPPSNIWGPSNSDFPPPAVSMGRYPVSPHSGSYGYPGAQKDSAPPPYVYPGNPQVSAGPPDLDPAQRNMFPSAPTYNPLPSAPMMNTDFLSQSDEAPPAYSLPFLSSATDKSDAK